jgi:hypothetical protein
MDQFIGLEEVTRLACMRIDHHRQHVAENLFPLCDVNHREEYRDLKLEYNTGYLNQGRRLYQVDCGKCERRLVKAIKSDDERKEEKVNITAKNPAYYCTDPSCWFLACGECYTGWVINTGDGSAQDYNIAGGQERGRINKDDTNTQQGQLRFSSRAKRAMS